MSLSGFWFPITLETFTGFWLLHLAWSSRFLGSTRFPMADDISTKKRALPSIKLPFVAENRCLGGVNNFV